VLVEILLIHHVVEDDIGTFVDLVCSTCEDAQTVIHLLNALTGYTPLLYDLDQERTDYNSIIDLCKRVWETLDQKKDLELSLVTLPTLYDCLENY